MSIEVALLAIVTSVAAGLMGSFAVMRRMSLAADPLSHVALPGIGVALALHREPIFGAVAALLVGAFLVWILEDRAQAATEAIIGVVFAAALAIGSLTTSGEDLIDALFGGGGAPTLPEVLFVLLAALGIIAFLIKERNRLVIMIVSPDMARTAGVNVRRVDLAYLLLFALTIGIGLRYLGVLLMGALIIIPAVTAEGVARNLREMLLLSVILAVLATLLGAGIASRAQLETGPVIVLVAAAGFLLSLLAPRGSAAASRHDPGAAARPHSALGGPADGQSGGGDAES
jgi:zinc transport system permease protein